MVLSERQSGFLSLVRSDSVPASSAVNLGFIKDAKTRFENFNRLRDIAEQRRSSLFSIPRDNPVSLWPVSFTRDV
jgi:hypothetical protein